ncbi:hypothetical protein JXA40_03065 [bacterium]|nr:hypothetical protein [candidate division CSSED10-310 bacterium]
MTRTPLSRLPAIILAVFLTAGCSKEIPIDRVDFKVSWDRTNPFEMTVIMTLPAYPGGNLILQRADISGTDHRRGWIEIDSPGSAEPRSNRWNLHYAPGSEIKYTYSFLLAEDDVGRSFRDSRADQDHLFIQSVDLFCFPHGVHGGTRYSVEIKLPEDFDLFTTWIKRGDTYLVGFDDLTSAFIVAGRFRTKTVKSGKSTVLLAIDNTRSRREDALIAQSLQKSLAGLQRELPIGTPGRFTFIVEKIRGNISRAMRRGNFILLGIPEILPFDMQERKKISHELFHLMTETTHDASWFEESASEYYAWLILVRTGQIRQQEFFRALAEKITQAQYSEYKDSLRSAIFGKGGEAGRNYIYSLGTLGMFALDIELHASGAARGVSEFITRLHGNPDNIPATEAVLLKYLKQYSELEAPRILTDFAAGKLDITRSLKTAGLDLKISGYTLLDVIQDSTGDYGRILPGDNLISIDYRLLDKAAWRRYLAEHVNEVVTVQIERSGKRIEQKHRIIPRYVIEPVDYSPGAVWQRILNE